MVPVNKDHNVGSVRFEILQPFHAWVAIPFSGFRCPYLRCNAQILDAIEKCNFLWNSSTGVLWDVVDKESFAEWPNYQKALNFYRLKDTNEISLPRLHSNVVQIPVSLPDDDMLSDRLTTNAAFNEIWTNMV